MSSLTLAQANKIIDVAMGKHAAETILGAVDASGGTGDEDEAVCMAGAEAAGLSYA